MTYQSKPTTNGVYRIKLLTKDLVIESVPVPGGRPWMKVAPPSSSNNKQKWNLEKVSNETDVWTITSFEDQAGVSYFKTRETYWGHGYPRAQDGLSEKWSILEQTSSGQAFSRIKLSSNPKSPDCFDSLRLDQGNDVVHFYTEGTFATNPYQCYVFERVPDAPRQLDIMFLQDATASQQQYIEAARSDVNQICTSLLNAGKFANIRFGLIAFRDHPPQEHSFVTKSFGFTSDVRSLNSDLKSLALEGGGDGPEAQADALAAALNAPWDDKAANVVVLITDSPPHGIGEEGDGFPKQNPSQVDPSAIGERMADLGITLYVLACEPTMSRYFQTARGFYEGLVAKTGGKVHELGNPGALAELITTSALRKSQL